MTTTLLNVMSASGFAYLVFVLGVAPDRASGILFAVVVGVSYYFDFRRWLERRRREQYLKRHYRFK